MPWPGKGDAFLYRPVLPAEWEKLVAPLTAASRSTSTAAPEAAWRDAIGTAGRHPNVSLKVSALIEAEAHSAGRPKARTDAAFYEPWLECAWDAFGMKRLLFGSNWPVSARVGSYADVLGVVRPFFAAKGPEAERWFFADGSRAAYRWA